MKYPGHFFFYLIITCLTAISCQPEYYEPNVDAGEYSFTLGEEIKVASGNSELSIRFVESLEHSLCPPNANCLWAGRVVVAISVNAQDTLILGAGDLKTGIDDCDSIQQTRTYLSHNITLLGAETQQVRRFPKEWEYVIFLKVEEE